MLPVLVWEIFNWFNFWRENRLVNVGWCCSHLNCSAYSFSVNFRSFVRASQPVARFPLQGMIARVGNSRGKFLPMGKTPRKVAVVFLVFCWA